MEIQVSTKYVRIAPRKAQIVAALVRGQDVNAALALLKFINKSASLSIGKLIKSAVANAESRGTIDIDNLYVKFINVTAGPTMKRFRAAPMGRPSKIRKRMCHISLVLDEK